MIRRPGVAVQEFARGCIRDGYFAPVDVERLVSARKGTRVA